MEKRPVKGTVLTACFIAAFACAAVTCSNYPVDTSGRDLLELESVWQYLKVYSIWQDSLPLPHDAFTFSTPESLLASVNDTLRGFQYTSYDSSGGASAEAGLAAASSPVTYGAISPRTAYVHIWAFTRETTLDSFLVAVPFLSRFQNIILDLRWNTGGDIATTDSIIDYFLPVNTPFIVATYRSYNGDARTASTVHDERWTTKHGHAPSLSEKNIVILMNHWSASASEILAAGIRDGRKSSGLGECLFVGDTSYGKGIGQVVVNRSQFRKRDIKITFLRVKRACGCADSIYHRKGLAPDSLVVNKDSTIADTLQFVAAFNVLEPGVHPRIIPVTQFLTKALMRRAEFLALPVTDFEK
jgi:hypothetical protein